jgi:hypothetical protein
VRSVFDGDDGVNKYDVFDIATEAGANPSLVVLDASEPKVSRTLKTMAGYRLVRLDRGERGCIRPRVTHDRIELDLQLSLSRKAG